MKFKKKNILITGVVITFIVTILISGGTFAYLKDKTDKTVNNFNTNKVIADITETENNYNIIPGTSQSKDPTVIVETTIPAYVYIIIEDNTEGLVEYEIDKRWAPLGEEYPGVYWLELEGNKDSQKIPILKDNKVFYDAMLENSDMLDENGNLKENITLTFSAKAIQKEPFNDPISAYEEKIQLNNSLTASFIYDGNERYFISETFETEDSLLIQASGLLYGPGFGFTNNKYIFSVTGSSNKDMLLSFDFDEKCGANEEYKGIFFEYGFGGYEDTYALAGEYHDWSTDSSGTKEDNFTLVGDYYPIVFTVKQIKSTGITNFETFTGSLTELIQELSSSKYALKAGEEYDDQFEITMMWAYRTEPTDDCYVIKNGQKDEADPDALIAYMDRADNIFGITAANPLPTVGYNLWADFEIRIDEIQ